MPAFAQSAAPATIRTLVDPDSNRIPVKLLLEIDEDYRQKAAADTLEKIAPEKLNRLGIAWLPVMDRTCQRWQFHVSFSNTLNANRLGKTSDWVVIRYKHTGFAGNRGVRHATVVTETHGPREGQRVVRGRETECHVSAQSRDEHPQRIPA